MFEAKIVSRADFPIIITYKGESKVVSPRESFMVEKLSMIEGVLHPLLKVQKLK